MNIKDIKIFAGNENIMRAYEICMAGNFKMKLINSQDEDSALSKIQFQKLSEYLAPAVTENTNEAEILVEVVKPDITAILNSRRQETKEEVDARAKAVLDLTNFPERMQESSAALLKTAYNKLDFMPYEVKIIVQVAIIIALLDNHKAETVDVNHIAEAIQYRSLPKEFRES